MKQNTHIWANVKCQKVLIPNNSYMSQISEGVDPSENVEMNKSECDEYIRIFEYIGHEYIFGHSFV